MFLSSYVDSKGKNDLPVIIMNIQFIVWLLGTVGSCLQWLLVAKFNFLWLQNRVFRYVLSEEEQLKAITSTVRHRQ